jgi:hypothetical protein
LQLAAVQAVLVVASDPAACVERAVRVGYAQWSTVRLSRDRTGMIDVLKVLVDALGCIVPVVARDQGRPARLGFDLLIAYATLNRSLMVAEDVVDEAELVAGQARDGDWVTGKGPGSLLSDLEYLLKTQLRNLNEVETMLVDRYCDQLTNADGNSRDYERGSGSGVLF